MSLANRYTVSHEQWDSRVKLSFYSVNVHKRDRSGRQEGPVMSVERSGTVNQVKGWNRGRRIEESQAISENCPKIRMSINNEQRLTSTTAGSTAVATVPEWHVCELLMRRIKGGRLRIDLLFALVPISPKYVYDDLLIPRVLGISVEE